MAYQHSFLETLPRECLRRGKTAFAYKKPFLVNDVCITIDDSWERLSLQFSRDTGQGVLFMKNIPGIQEDDIVALCELYALVHRVIQTIVGLALHNNGVTGIVGVGLGFLHGVVA